jgi:hypothetical protein
MFTVQHGREQRELPILISPRAPQDLAIDRHGHHPAGVDISILSQPGAGYPIQLVGINTTQDPTDRPLTRGFETEHKMTPFRT